MISDMPSALTGCNRRGLVPKQEVELLSDDRMLLVDPTFLLLKEVEAELRAVLRCGKRASRTRLT